MKNAPLCEQIERDGFAVCADVLDEAQIETVLQALNEQADGDDDSARRRGDTVFARRNLLDVEMVRELARSASVRALAESVLGENCFAVRGILFDKTPGANWKVPWHQDLSIAVREKNDVPGFEAWSQKAGVLHVQPPMPILEQMLAMRIHLDACDEANAPLKVLPSSHRGGRLGAAQIADWRTRAKEISCVAPRGSALLMKPLLLHASSSATRAGHRRVLHLEWAAHELPFGLEWQHKV